MIMQRSKSRVNFDTRGLKLSTNPDDSILGHLGENPNPDVGRYSSRNISPGNSSPAYVSKNQNVTNINVEFISAPVINYNFNFNAQMPGPELSGFSGRDSTQADKKKFQTQPINGSFASELLENFGYCNANFDTKTLNSQMTIRINGEVYGQDTCPGIVDIEDPTGENSANENMALGISKAMGAGVMKVS
jgi:hypothetical protein